MRQVIIGILLAVFLVGCGEQSEFSIDDKTSPDFYDKNKAFTRQPIKENATVQEKAWLSVFPSYEFTSLPFSVYGIKTNDLDIVKGYIRSSTIENVTKDVMIVFKGKSSFDKLA